ncbi:MAG: tetratricopeptide repeat protein [Clostridia bacterium]
MDNKIKNILEEINKNISGVYEKDIMYLNEQLEKYQEYIYEKQITNYINDKIVLLKFQNEFKDEEKLEKKDENKLRKILEKAKEYMAEEKYSECKKTLEKFLSRVVEIYGDDNKVYVSLENKIEYKILKKYYRTLRKTYNLNIPAVEMYIMYADILIKEGKNKEAISILEEALNINPVSTKILFKLAQINKAIGDLKAFKANIDTVYKYIYKEQDLATYYAYRAYLCIVANKIDFAKALNTLAIYFKADENILKENIEFAKIKKESLKKIKLSEATALIKTTKIPIGASENIYKIILALYNESETDLNSKEKYRRLLLEYTGDAKYKNKVKLTQIKYIPKEVKKMATMLYKGRYLSIIKKDKLMDPQKIVFFDFCSHNKNVLEKLMRYEFNINKDELQVNCEQSILKVPCEDCSVKICPMYHLTNVATDVKENYIEDIKTIDFISDKLYENNEEKIEEMKNEITSKFSDAISIKTAAILLNFNFVKFENIEGKIITYNIIDFANAPSTSKTIESINKYYIDSEGIEKTLDIDSMKTEAKKGSDYLCKESPYVIAAYAGYLSKKLDVNPEIVFEKIIREYKGFITLKGLVFYRLSLNEISKLNLGKELYNKCSEMFMYMASNFAAKNKLPYIPFNFAIYTEDSAIVKELAKIINKVVKFYKYIPEAKQTNIDLADVDIKEIDKVFEDKSGVLILENMTRFNEYSNDISKNILFALENQLIINSRKTINIVYGKEEELEKVLEGKDNFKYNLFSNRINIKEFSKKEIQKRILNKIKNNYDVEEDFADNLEQYILETYSASVIKNTEYVDVVYKKIILNLMKDENNKKLVTKKEIPSLDIKTK